MPRVFFALAAGLLAACGSVAETEDVLLRKAIHAYHVTPHEPAPRPFGPKERLGQALFFDPIVSGPRQIACAACHVRSKGAGDALPLAVGLGASGVSEERLAAKDAFVVPRNALPFFNRGAEDFRAFFWDGSVQIGPSGQFESPLGARLPVGFDNLLAVASVFPLAAPDEMLGRSHNRAGPGQYHLELVPENIDEDNFQRRTLAVFDRLLKRLLGIEDTDEGSAVLEYRRLFQAAYPDVALSNMRISHVGNALAAYIAAAFDLEPSPWDRYVEGDANALTPAQKHGALIFFGKGRCAVCHSGRQFSDFRFHGLAIPQMRVGKHGGHLDYGRAAVTSRGEDRFAFRTPPLRNVTITGPWAHNGIFTSLEAIIAHHINPVPALYAAQQKSPEEAAYAGRLLGFRSPILAEMVPLSINDIARLVDFLGALTSAMRMPDSLAIPARVPSGNVVFLRR